MQLEADKMRPINVVKASAVLRGIAACAVLLGASQLTASTISPGAVPCGTMTLEVWTVRDAGTLRRGGTCEIAFVYEGFLTVAGQLRA